MDKETISINILQLLSDMQEDGLIHHEEALTANSKLYGLEGVLSSLNLVNLIVDIESMVLAETGKALNLSNDKVFSAKNSPFATVESLISYVTTELVDG